MDSDVGDGGVASPTVRVLGTAVFVVSAFLLTSMGGAGMVASPITLPLMYVLTRQRRSRAFLNAGLIIGTLTALQGGWGLGYVVLGHSSGGAALVGLGTAAVAALVFALIPWRPRVHRDRTASAGRGTELSDKEDRGPRALRTRSENPMAR